MYRALIRIRIASGIGEARQVECVERMGRSFGPVGVAGVRPGAR